MDNQRAEDLGDYAEDYQDAEEFEDMEDDLDDDESIEAFGEDDMDDDESFDGEDYDDDEDIEAYMEDDLDDDETYEVEDYDDDEGLEYDDDDEAFDEGYADMGEAVEMYAAERSRRGRRARRRDWIARQNAKMRANLLKKRALAARKKAIRNAKKAQLMINKKLRAVRGRGRVFFPRISKVRGTGYVTAILPNGRKTKMMFKPSLATRTDVNRLTRQIRTNGVKQARAIRVQGKNIKLLKSAQSSAIKSLTAQQLKAGKLLTKQIADGDKNLDKRITKLVSAQKKSGRRQDQKMLRQVRQQQKRSTWNTALVASAIPLFAAYGDRAVGEKANPLTKKNLLIAGSTAGWLFADDLISRYVMRGSKKWRSAGNVWNVVAPFMNCGMVYYFMKDKQHERFVTGVAQVKGIAENSPVDIPVGTDHKFDTFDNPPVVATIMSTDNDEVVGVKARVEKGKLYLTLKGDSAKALSKNSGAMVAWQVDTLNPAYKR